MEYPLEDNTFSKGEVISKLAYLCPIVAAMSEALPVSVLLGKDVPVLVELL